MLEFQPVADSNGKEFVTVTMSRSRISALQLVNSLITARNCICKMHIEDCSWSGYKLCCWSFSEKKKKIINATRVHSKVDQIWWSAIKLTFIPSVWELPDIHLSK